MSPSSPHLGDAKTAFADVTIPWMLLTGTRDISPIGEADMKSSLRRLPGLAARQQIRVGSQQGGAFGVRRPRTARRERETQSQPSSRDRGGDDGVLGRLPSQRCRRQEMARWQGSPRRAPEGRPLAKEMTGDLMFTHGEQAAGSRRSARPFKPHIISAIPSFLQWAHQEEHMAFRCSAALTAFLLIASLGRAVDPNDTRLLSMPAISAQNIAFVYADDLWVADRDGKNPRRLTSDIGVETNPCFSPDGSIIAFSAQYDGNTDVYTIPVTGGEPKRLDLSSRRRHRSRLHAGRPVHPVQFEPLCLQQPAFAAFHRAARRRHADAIADPLGLRSCLFAGWAVHRLLPGPRCESPVEALPRRHAFADLALFDQGPRDRRDAATKGPLQRSRSAMDRQSPVLPVGSQRRVQHILVSNRRQEPKQLTHFTDFPVLDISTAPARSSSNRPATCTR